MVIISSKSDKRVKRSFKKWAVKVFSKIDRNTLNDINCAHLLNLRDCTKTLYHNANWNGFKTHFSVIYHGFTYWCWLDSAHGFNWMKTYQPIRGFFEIQPKLSRIFNKWIQIIWIKNANSIIHHYTKREIAIQRLNFSIRYFPKLIFIVQLHWLYNSTFYPSVSGIHGPKSVGPGWSRLVPETFKKSRKQFQNLGTIRAVDPCSV